jgi:hypothetical protein
LEISNSNFFSLFIFYYRANIWVTVFSQSEGRTSLPRIDPPKQFSAVHATSIERLEHPIARRPTKPNQTLANLSLPSRHFAPVTRSDPTSRRRQLLPASGAPAVGHGLSLTADVRTGAPDPTTHVSPPPPPPILPRELEYSARCAGRQAPNLAVRSGASWPCTRTTTRARRVNGLHTRGLGGYQDAAPDPA